MLEIENCLYIGRVMYLSENQEKGRFAHLQPLYRKEQEESQWHSLQPAEFPYDVAIWLQVPGDVQYGTTWQFSVVRRASSRDPYKINPQDIFPLKTLPGGSSLDNEERILNGEAPTSVETSSELGIEEENNAYQQDLQGVTEEIQQKQAELLHIQQEIDTQRQTLEAQVKEFELALKMRVTELLKQPEQVLSEMALFRAAFGNIQEAESQPEKTSTRHRSSSVHSSLWHATETDVPAVREHLQIRKTLSSGCTTLGLASNAGRWLHAAFLAGAMPVVAGSSAFELLKLYATCIAGGRLLWIPVSPTLIDGGDLLGRADPSSGWFVPHPGGLLDLLRHANKPENQNDLFLVVLDGINRAAIDAYLYPLLACFNDRSLTSGKRKLPLVHPAALTEDAPSLAQSEIEWPANVLLAGTLSDSATCIAPPASFWDYATFLPTGFVRAEKSGGKNATPTPPRPTSAVPFVQWTHWQAEIWRTGNQTTPDWLDSFVDDSLYLSIGGSNLISYVDAALKHISEEDFNGVITQCIIPQALATGQKDALVQKLEQSITTLEKEERHSALLGNKRAYQEYSLEHLEIVERLLR